MIQLDLFAAPPPPATAPRPLDAMAEMLVRDGWAANEFLLGLNGVHPSYEREFEGVWALPSRLIQHPIQVSKGCYEKDGQTRVYLRHPLLADHPWVMELADALGGMPEVIDGYGNHGEWWHAVDLGSAGMWGDLIETERFTTRGLIVQAVGHCLHYRSGKFGPADARRVLGSIEDAEPEASFEGLMAPSPCDKRWPINGRYSPWRLVHGIENQWMKYSGTFLEWSEAGRAEWKAQAA